MNRLGTIRFDRTWLVILVLIAVGMILVGLRYARSVAAESSMTLLRSSNQATAASINRHASSLVGRAVSLAEDPEMLAYLESSSETIPSGLSARMNQDATEDWQVVRRNRSPAGPTNKEGSNSVDWASLDTGEPSLEFYRSVADGFQAMVAAPIMDGARAKGCVVLRIGLSETIKDMGFGKQANHLTHSLVNQNGETIAGLSRDRLPSGVSAPAISMTAMTESLRRRSSGENQAGYPNGNGEVVLGVWEFLPNWNVGVATEFPRHGALAGVHFIERWFAGLAIVGLLGAGITRYRRKKNVGTPGHPGDSRSFGNYQIGEALGRGGMGIVYRARHLGLRRDVAVKVLEGKSLSELAVARFEREVQLTAKLQHPNTIAVYDYGRSDDGAFFYAMELIDGLTLQELIDGFGAQPPERVIHLLLQVCGSLAEAHGMGLIHRDIKPANILVSRGVGTGDLVKVLDFGLVKDIHDDSEISLTRNDSITGTPMYMSPEAVRDAGGTNTQSDLYSIAAVGYTLLAGRPMFEAKTSVEICMQQMKADPALPEESLGEPLPSDLQSVIMTGLRKDPADRWLSVEDFATALSRCADAGKWSLAESEFWWSKAGRKAIPKNESPQLNTVAQKTLT